MCDHFGRQRRCPRYGVCRRFATALTRNDRPSERVLDELLPIRGRRLLLFAIELRSSRQTWSCAIAFPRHVSCTIARWLHGGSYRMQPYHHQPCSRLTQARRGGAALGGFLDVRGWREKRWRRGENAWLLLGRLLSLSRDTSATPTILTHSLLYRGIFVAIDAEKCRELCGHERGWSAAEEAQGEYDSVV